MSDSMAALILRIEQLEAASEIVRLSADYCHGADHRNLDLFSSVWAENGVWQVRDDLVFTGIEQIQAAIKRQWEMSSRGFHWTSNPSIALSADGSSAKARFDVKAETELLDSTRLSIAGSYYDTYVKLGEGWKLARRAAKVHSQRSI